MPPAVPNGFSEALGTKEGLKRYGWASEWCSVPETAFCGTKVSPEKNMEYENLSHIHIMSIIRPSALTNVSG